MKRSAIRRSTTPLKRRRSVRGVSERREAERALRAAVVALVTARDHGRCSAAALVPEVACGGPLDAHEIIPRSAWRAGYLVPSNILSICRRHHEFVDAHPATAAKLGLHGFSWQRPGAESPSALELDDHPKEEHE